MSKFPIGSWEPIHASVYTQPALDFVCWTIYVFVQLKEQILWTRGPHELPHNVPTKCNVKIFVKEQYEFEALSAQS